MHTGIYGKKVACTLIALARESLGAPFMAHTQRSWDMQFMAHTER